MLDKNKKQPSEPSHFPIAGGGICGDLFLSINWSDHPLGDPESWPPSLRMAIQMIFNCRHPMFLFWGPENFQFYNDAYLPSFINGKHPKAMGQRGIECWPEIWKDIFPQIEYVMSGKGSTWNENHLLPIYRNGRLEDVYWTYSYSPLFDERGKIQGTLVVCTETTQEFVAKKEQYRLTRELEEAKDFAEKSNELKSAFLANMSHEIRTPLGAILGFSEILKYSNFSLEERERYIEIIQRNGNALTKIIDDILDLSKIEAGKLQIDHSPLCLVDLARDVLLLFQDQASEKNVSLETDSSLFPSFKIDSDAIRIRQILVNLVGNALKFTPQGHVKIYGNFMEISENLYRIFVYVSDTGIGMSTEQAELLFHPFSRVNHGGQKFSGTGLGLALCKKLGRALGGDVSVERCREKQGCVFRFEFVARKSYDSLSLKGSGEEISKDKEKPYSLHGFLILVVDDSEDNRTLMKILLEKHGAKIALAAGGKDVVGLAQKINPDLILMDIQMPEVDGYEALSQLLKNEVKKPILALTAHAMKEERDRALMAGFKDHITKPIHGPELIETIARHLK